MVNPFLRKNDQGFDKEEPFNRVFRENENTRTKSSRGIVMRLLEDYECHN